MHEIVSGCDGERALEPDGCKAKADPCRNYSAQARSTAHRAECTSSHSRRITRNAWALAGLALVIALCATALANAEPPASAGEPITITRGGTYTGTWTSTDATPAVTIETAEPVRIVNATVTNLAGGPLVESPFGVEATIMLQRVVAIGGSGRFLDAERFKTVVVRNCSIERTSGIRLASPVPGSSIVITRNRHRNVQRADTHYGNFVQFAEVQNATVDVSWNEVVNVFDRSEPEDLVSIFKSAHIRVHDNYFEGQYPPGNSAQSSQNGITIENGNAVGPTSHDNDIWNNQVVDSVGGIAVFAGDRNRLYANRVVQDGHLPSGVKLRSGGRGLSIHSGSANRAYGNLVGFVNALGGRSDMWFPVAPGEYGRNRSIRGRVRRVNETAERKAWLAKLAAAKVRIGR